MQPLFVEPQLVKKAQPAGGQLPTNSAEWPVRIRDEWAKTAPFASGFPAEIVISEKDDEKGYAFGHIILTSKTSLQAGQAIGQLGAQFGVRTVKVPVVVEDFQLYPFDMLVNEDGALLPLNEGRLREALFRPSLTDVPAKGPGNELFGGVLYPPMREANLTKASAYPVLEGIVDTIEKEQVDRLARDVSRSGMTVKIAADADLWGYLDIVNHLKTREPLTKRAALSAITPDVVLIRREEGPTYVVKTAVRGAYDPQEYTFDRGQALHTFGDEKVKEADAKGIVIIIRRKQGMGEPSIGGGPDSFGMEGSGPCRAMDAGGSPMMGHLFSKIRSILSGGDLPMKLFSDGSRFGMGEDIGASPCGEAPELESGSPSGTGVFCWEGDEGKVCTEPLNAHGMTVENGRKSYLVETLAGQRVAVVPSEQAQTVAPGGDGFTLVPASARWIRLGDKMVSLATSAEAGAQMEAKTASTRCRVRYSGGQFHFEGWPLRKLGNLTGVSPTDAMFVCGLMGFSKTSAQHVLARTMKKLSTYVVGVPEIRTYDEMEKEARSRTAEAVKEARALALPFFVKEATGLGDPQSVDAVLSLGFLNLDNVARFVTYIPHLEATIRKLCLLLLSARLGLSELPQDHLSRAISAIEQALGGLRRVALRLSPVNSVLS